jgi:metal-responsive CopG/Arc/MetJ family transcriptional regulator
MKTAISLPDAVYEAADDLAGRMKVTRSKLYVMALEKFIKENQESDITNRINQFIEKHGQPNDSDNLTVSDMRKVDWQ